MRGQETDRISEKSVVMNRLGKRSVIAFALAITVFMIFAPAASAELVYINDAIIPHGDSITVPILIDVTDPDGLGAATITLYYDSNVVEITAVSDWVFDNASSNIQNSSGYTRIVAYQESINGVGPGTIQFANVTLHSIGALGESSVLGLDVITLKNNSGQPVPYTVSNGTFTTTEAMAPDTTPPSSITNLNYITESTWINWTWIDPNDLDFSHVEIYLNGTFQINVSKGIQYYTATNLTPDTSYTLNTRTVDIVGNVNATWVNLTISTEVKGDFNNNGNVDIGDVAKVAYMLVDKVADDIGADFNGNGRVDIGDAAKIAYYLVGKVPEL